MRRSGAIDKRLQLIELEAKRKTEDEQGKYFRIWYAMLIRAIDEIAPERKEEIIETLLEALDVVDRRDRAHDYPLDLLSWQGLSPGDAGMRT